MLILASNQHVSFPAQDPGNYTLGLLIASTDSNLNPKVIRADIAQLLFLAKHISIKVHHQTLSWSSLKAQKHESI